MKTAIITGGWLRNWSFKNEAGERVCRVESLLSDEGYSLSESRQIRPGTDRVITIDKMLQTTSEKSIWDMIVEEVKPTDSSHAGNLHMLIWNMLNLKPECQIRRFGKSSWDEYNPGEIEVPYAINNEIPKKSSNCVDLIVKTIRPYNPTSFGLGISYTMKEQTLFDWGDTKKLIVEVRTFDNDFAKKILEVAHKK